MNLIRIGLPILLVSIVAGCALTPSGTKEQRDRLTSAGENYARPFKERKLPELPSNPTWRDVLHRAFMANGELEASYFEWKAAVERIDIVSAWPNSNLALGYSYALGPGQMKTFDRMTFSAGIDSMKNLSFPAKVAKDGEIGLANARAAGERFRAAKFDLQRRVLTGWAEYALLAEQVRIETEEVLLARVALDTSKSRVQTGGVQEDLLKAQIAYRTTENGLRSDEAELRAARASLNGMLGRDPQADLFAPKHLPAPRSLPGDDAILLAKAVEQNPELAALGHGVEGRAEALQRARMEWVPDINPFVSVTGGVAQMVGATVVLPTTIRQIEGGVREADAMLKASDAMLRQSKQEKAATFVATLVLLRDAERQSILFRDTVVPATQQMVTAVRHRYSAGSATYLDLLDAQRTLLDSRLVLARALVMREKRLAELEALMGADIETLVGSSGATENADSSTPANTPNSGAAETSYEK